MYAIMVKYDVAEEWNDSWSVAAMAKHGICVYVLYLDQQ